MRCDLHLHSRYSSHSATWLLRRFDFPDSYSEPRQLLQKLQEKGMKFFTLTDHNTIDGCLEIADRPGVFISEEVTAYFPSRECKVHLLVWGLNEAQHREISELRENIFDLQAYLQQQKLVHAVAHPLASLNKKLTPHFIEQLILLFKHFEGINGLKPHLLNQTFVHITQSLTPEKIAALAEKHGITPTHANPWQKIWIAGSDDHSGLFPATTYTEVGQGARCHNAQEFLAHVESGNVEMRGHSGTPLILSHGLYNSIYLFAKDRLQSMVQTPLLVETMFSRFMEGKNPTEFSLSEKLQFVAQGILTGKIFDLIKPANASLWNELSTYFSQPTVKEAIAKATANVEEPERRAFLIANLFANQLAYRFFKKFVAQVSHGNIMEGLQAVSAIAPISILLSPYLYAFKSEVADRKQLRFFSESITGEIAPCLQNKKRAWLTDTLEDVTGVATTIRKMMSAGREAGHDITVITSRTRIDIDDIPIKNFKPIGEFEIPEYELQKLTFPPILEMLDYIYHQGFTELIISTPGPVGLVGLLAAKLFNLRTVGIYHTDFPQYVQILTDDHFWESLAWRYMYWFYHQLDLMYVNSNKYRSIWIERGIAPEKIQIFSRGIDTELFHPNKRDKTRWDQYGVDPDETVLLYVGRISVEKNLDVLAEAYQLVCQTNPKLRLVIVGDGVYKKKLKQQIPQAVFTGYLAGEDLAWAYASADLFAFPSISDTFGNVVVEAQASGLPVIVSDQKGPQELVQNGVTGLITRGLDSKDLAQAIQSMVQDENLRAKMGAAARSSLEGRNWSTAFEKFWNTSPV